MSCAITLDPLPSHRFAMLAGDDSGARIFVTKRLADDSRDRNYTESAPMAAMPEKPRSNRALRAVTPPSA